MNQQKFIESFLSLPSEAQHQVLNFIAVLQQRYELTEPKNRSRSKQLLSYEFMGMWRDRQDLADSTSWVRHLRESEW
ncbi:MAG TPA: hypothetical protein IGS17_04475 [Oscillatoriales cyanobacterium M59_W2019_021]|nr:MAG: hypothetical protein D6728_04575 [Cyanobacteria bacterium J055]HIK32720.1 hypothetical protein [Oscillatoriales cyanobacterium M4454_W2019_049]HIK50172.1 hypothetical protein [Oscillatoriales cyanobacterium M59_W2019_021]